MTPETIAFFLLIAVLGFGAGDCLANKRYEHGLFVLVLGLALIAARAWRAIQ